ncbi:MAG: mandelate racemase/muconate lactonizing enzyme family protein [Pirellulaceae bacterium]
MKIVDIQPLPVDRYLFVKVLTDEGICGFGESGAWGFLEASHQAIETFKRYLIGQDPLRIEHHWQYLYRWTHFRGAAIMGALSALDIALWDIAGKHFGVPCYQLLGGACRDRLRTYCHVFGKTTQQLVEGCINAKKQGFTAVGHLTPFLDEPREVPMFQTHVAKIRDAIDTVRQYREAVGNEMDLCIEIHRQLTPAEAVVLARGIEPFHPFFYEDPTLPDNLDAMARIAEKIHVPIATGERLHTIHEFEMLLARGAVQYVRPDVCICGGLTHAKKIAALAEAHYVNVVPHNPLGPISTAACAQLAACIPNFALLEYPTWDWRPPGDSPDGAERLLPAGPLQEQGRPHAETRIVKEPLKVEDGFLILPDAPGIGVELTEDVLENCPYRPRRLKTRLHCDGSVVDQ